METIKSSMPMVKAYAVARLACSSFRMFAVPRIEVSIERRNEMFARAVLVSSRGLANPDKLDHMATMRLPTIQQPLMNSRARFTVTNQVRGFSFSNAVISNREIVFRFELIKIMLSRHC